MKKKNQNRIGVKEAPKLKFNEKYLHDFRGRKRDQDYFAHQ